MPKKRRLDWQKPSKRKTPYAPVPARTYIDSEQTPLSTEQLRVFEELNAAVSLAVGGAIFVLQGDRQTGFTTAVCEWMSCVPGKFSFRSMSSTQAHHVKAIVNDLHIGHRVNVRPHQYSDHAKGVNYEIDEIFSAHDSLADGVVVMRVIV